MQNSNVLVVGRPHTKALDFGADFVDSYSAAQDYLLNHHPSVLLFGHDGGEAESFCQFVAHHCPDSLWIVAYDRTAPAALLRWSQFGKLHGLVESFDDPELESKLKSALEASGEAVQRGKLVELFADQSARLKRLSTDLESRVERRHRSLRKSLRTLESTKARMEALHKALLGIHRASSVLQIERTLNDALRGSIDVEWVRIRFESQSLLSEKSAPHILGIDLPFRFENLQGEILFGKKKGRKFTSRESDFLYELSDAVALSLARLHKLEQAETVKGQWQATFDSIPHPLCLVGRDLEILKLNRAFQRACPEQTFLSLLGKDCFTVFFGRPLDKSSIKRTRQGQFNFRATRTGVTGTEHFEVTGQPVGLGQDRQNVHLFLFREITEEVRFERRILETSKLAELGTIGSSIAHELNNPLGGMLSFIQLILMDLKKESPLFDDVKAMEASVLRCRDIVQNLLSFSRKQDLGEFHRVDIWEVIERAVKLIELQSKSMGITISARRSSPVFVMANANSLSQALCNLLQNSLDAIGERLKIDTAVSGAIQIDVSRESDGDRDGGSDNGGARGEKFKLQISDNGTGIRPEEQSQIFNPMFTTRDPGLRSGMGLTTALTIVTEHHGTLEILSQTGSSTTAVIHLPIAPSC